jgi:hypothetical protein
LKKERKPSFEKEAIKSRGYIIYRKKIILEAIILSELEQTYRDFLETYFLQYI